MTDAESSDQKRVLLVEGQNDMHVVRHIWLRHYTTGPTFGISIKDDVNSLLRSIRGEVLREDRTVVGILLDADDHPAYRWQSVRDKLRSAHVDSPNKLPPSGVIIDQVPRVGVWMMPDNQLPGELEDFIEKMIPPTDPVWPLSHSYIDGIPIGNRKFAQGKILRAKVHAWLATREDPRPMGTAIRARDLDVHGPLGAAFLSWLNRLFN